MPEPAKPLDLRPGTGRDGPKRGRANAEEKPIRYLISKPSKTCPGATTATCPMPAGHKCPRPVHETALVN